MNIHAIIIALNEEDFITETIRPLYGHCSGISVITQYDRDYYGKPVQPDTTIQKVLAYPDPIGKIHLVVRRYNDETASRNHEMMAVLQDASAGILSHGVPLKEIRRFHQKPDYFLIVDADEIYDINTIGGIIEYLGQHRPRAMRVSAYDYCHNWNRRTSRDEYVHHHFGFVKAGLMFEQRRVLTWNEYRINRLFSFLGKRIKAGTRLYGFIDCPWEVGMLHHAGYVRRNRQRLREKMEKHSHLEAHTENFLDKWLDRKLTYVPTNELPENIRNGEWPQGFFEEESTC